ncbi:MAG: 50S ribosomal protein L11 methyltransferase [Deltaproteobacteria bacterium]|nr:50S ribosomal protein L11 methyltransferase [Deltaproteobacteria bacterium]
MCAWQVGIDTHSAALSALGNLLEARGGKAAPGGGEGSPALVASFEGAPDLSLVDAVGAWLSNLDARDARLRTRADVEGAWEDGWRAVFLPQALSERIGVYPVWATKPQDGRPAWLSVDPALAFGAGAHPTTRAALRLLDACLAARPGATVLDVGAGSGILAIAAAVLGSEAVGVEIDPQAVRVAQANALRNGVAGRARFMAGKVEQVPGPFDVVVANILADIVCDMAPALIERATGDLVVTAMPGAEAERVIETFSQFALVSTVDDGEWRLLHLRREAAPDAGASTEAAAKAPKEAAKAPGEAASKAAKAPGEAAKAPAKAAKAPAKAAKAPSEAAKAAKAPSEAASKAPSKATAKASTKKSKKKK